MGEYAARTIAGDLAGRPRRPFSYWDKGQLAVIGRGQAVADIWKLHFGGFLAWLIWIFVHIFFLIGFRNRVLVLIQWAWSYFTYGRGARLITGERSAAPAAAPAGRDARPARRDTRRGAQGARRSSSASSPAASPTRARRPTPIGSTPGWRKGYAGTMRYLHRQAEAPEGPAHQRARGARRGRAARELLLAGRRRRTSTRATGRQVRPGRGLPPR